MLKIKKIFLPLFATIAVLFFANPVLAGGGPVEMWAEPNTPLNPGEVYIVHARVSGDSINLPNYCKNCLIRLKFQNPQEGDVINQNSERTDEKGEVFAKVISKVPGKRVIYPTDLQASDGKLINSANYMELAYTGQSALPSTPLVNFYAQVNDLSVEGVKRLINISWNFLPDIVKVNVYLRLAERKNYGAATASSSMLYPRTTQIGINAFLDWYIKVDACKTAESCISYEMFVPALKKDENKLTTPKPSAYPSVTPQASSKTEISPEPRGDNGRIEDLNKKVENLQKQLQESQKRQASLEQRVNELIKWIKSFLPFFK